MQKTNETNNKLNRFFPIKSLKSSTIIISIILQVGIQLSTQLISLWILSSKEWYKRYIRSNFDEMIQIEASFENSV